MKMKVINKCRLTQVLSLSSRCVYCNDDGTTTCFGLNVNLRSQLLVSLNINLYSTFYEFYTVGLKMTVLGRRLSPRQRI